MCARVGGGGGVGLAQRMTERAEREGKTIPASSGGNTLSYMSFKFKIFLT